MEVAPPGGSCSGVWQFEQLTSINMAGDDDDDEETKAFWLDMEGIKIFFLKNKKEEKL